MALDHPTDTSGAPLANMSRPRSTHRVGAGGRFAAIQIDSIRAELRHRRRREIDALAATRADEQRAAVALSKGGVGYAVHRADVEADIASRSLAPSDPREDVRIAAAEAAAA